MNLRFLSYTCILPLLALDALRKLDHADHPTDGWSGYLMTPEEFALRSATAWKNPEDEGKFFIIPITAISSGHQEQARENTSIRKKSQIHMMSS